MVNNVVNATYVETYDMNTALNEMSLLGIHTPQANSLKTMYKGLFEQYKKYKILSCDLALVCASTQNLTPDLVGQEAGDVDPRDVLNPILFKACTGESIDILANKIYDSTTADTHPGSMDVHRIDTGTTTAPLSAYYQFLADDSWRKAHPQRGLVVNNLKPFVHKVVTTQPFRWTGYNGVTNSDNRSTSSRPLILGKADPDSGNNPAGFGSPNGQTVPNPSVFVSDGVVDMPWLDTTYEGQFTFRNPDGTAQNSPQMAIGLINDVPKVWCGAIILPPAILCRLFFRMQIRWHIQFKDFRPAYEVGPLASSYATSILSSVGYDVVTEDTSSSRTYFNLYHSTRTLDQSKSSFDCTGNAEISEVNQKAM